MHIRWRTNGIGHITEEWIVHRRTSICHDHYSQQYQCHKQFHRYVLLTDLLTLPLAEFSQNRLVLIQILS